MRNEMRKKTITVVTLTLIVLLGVILWHRIPIIGNELSKQTLFVGLTDLWYGDSKDQKAYAMWIDDDSTIGVFKVKEIADSLASWQRQGAGIVLHGLRHERWWDWDENQIDGDIQQSYQRLYEQGFDTTKVLKIIIPPHGCNNRTIRKVIQQHGCKMVSGATLINPDRHVFQYGRIGIGPDTDIEEMRIILQKAYDRKAFVIFGTHSSIPRIFSVKKTTEVMQMAKDMGFCFNIYE